jgi:hypothetical protein
LKAERRNQKNRQNDQKSAAEGFKEVHCLYSLADVN